jgi:uncharacterized protein (TIGR02444 family)
VSEDVWSFALDLYAQPGVEPACLALQDAGADVCLLLAGAWFGWRGVACDAQHLAELRELARPLREELVMPLRALRQQWRAQARLDQRVAELRESVKALELRAERLLLERLADAGRNWTSGSGDDLDAWLQGCAGAAAEQHRDALLELRIAVTHRKQP